MAASRDDDAVGPSDADRWRRIDAAFDEALAVPREAVDAFLADRYGDDPDLCRDVRSLIVASDRAREALGESIAGYAASLLPDLQRHLERDELPPGASVGAYRILGEIARGGMGTVHLAERDDATHRRQVAIKVVRRGLDTDEVLRRFRHERQILASLNHPNIARLYDAGATGDGRPYLVMEYVRGEPIDQWCDAHRLDVRERLRLFLAVCEAVEYAHRNLIVHRDVKPSNVLVTAEGSPVLLDFGIAKLLDDDLSLDAPRTRPEQRLLTPEWAAPEQGSGDPITTATDVYALGMLLHHLLTGRLPERGRADGAAATSAEVVRPSALVRRDVQRRRPEGRDESTSAAELALRMRSTPERLSRALRGDLDTIIRTAVARQPERRYAGAGALRDDVLRHLEGRPIEARPASLGYRMASFVRRNRALSVATGTALVAMLALTSFYTMRVTAERDVSRREAAKASATAAFLEEVFAGADPDEAIGDTLTAYQLLDRGAARLDTTLHDAPEVRATVQRVLGALFLKLGKYDRARPLLEEALETRLAVHGEAHADVAESLLELARLSFRIGDYAASDSLFARVVATRQRVDGERAASVGLALNDWGDMLAYAGRYADARHRYTQALDILDAAPGDNRRAIDASRFGLATLLRYDGDFMAAEPKLREVVETRRVLYGNTHSAVATALNDLGVLLYQMARYDDAEPLLLEALAIHRRLFGETHPEVSLSLNNLALVPYGRRDWDGADSLLRQALDIKVALLGREHRDIGLSLNNRAWLSLERGDHATAIARFEEAYGILRRASGDTSADAGLLLGNLARAHAAAGNIREAERHHQAALRVLTALHGPMHLSVAGEQTRYGRFLVRQERRDDAERALREALRIRETQLGDTHDDVARTRTELADLLHANRDHTRAEPLYRQVLRQADTTSTDYATSFASAARPLADCLAAQGRFAEAEPLLLRAAALLDAAPQPDPEVRPRVIRSLVALYRQWGRASDARRWEAQSPSDAPGP